MGGIAGWHCWVPLWGPWLDAIAGCDCRMLATKFSGVHVGCHCWAPLLGAIAWAPLFGAIAGCHCWGAIAGCHCGVPWLDAIAACHCEKPLRERIGQSVTPFSAALFSALITHKLACAIWGLCRYNFSEASKCALGASCRHVHGRGPCVGPSHSGDGDPQRSG